jgi:hypothetical protein
MRRSRQRASQVVRALALLIGASALLVAASAMAHEPDAEEIALGSLVDAEFAFAHMAAERGVRGAFLANFAADGIALEPAPVRVHEAFPARPAPADPLALKVEWKPAQAGVARSHDFGYTTGPYSLQVAAQPARVQHGAFFSVWQRNAIGRWQVALDVGITAPEAVNFVPLGAAPRPAFRGHANPQQERKGLLAREANAFSAGAAGLTPSAYAQLLAPDVRLHRDGIAPLASRGEVAKEVARRIARVTWAPIDARVAASADLAVTYGRYREIDHAQKPSDGYYAHLWLRDAAGRWALAYDIALAAPE